VVFTVYQFFVLPLPPLLHLPCALELSRSPRAQFLQMPVKRVAHKDQMSKKKGVNAATSWVPSEFKQADLAKTQKEGFLVEGDQVVFPSSERIPKPPSDYRVMFLAFLLRGLSLPAHEFLRGLLFVYGVQLHQLTPNSILHIACFITLCESFLGDEPHWIL
jgi:hypothetical protein